MSLFKDLLELVTPVAHAEEAEEATQVDEAPQEDAAEEDAEAEDAEEEEEEEDEDDDDEELEDPQDTLREECKNLPECKPYNHHLEECIERVTKAQEHPDHHLHAYHENCVEEYFHQQHFINECMAPKLFNKLK